MRLVAAADRHAVQTADHRLAAFQNRLDIAGENPHVLEIVARPLGVVGGVLLDIAACAERFVAGAGVDDHPDAVVPGRVRERLSQFHQAGGAVGVVELGAIDRDGRDPVFFLVNDFLETVFGRVFGLKELHFSLFHLLC